MRFPPARHNPRWHLLWFLTCNRWWTARGGNCALKSCVLSTCAARQPLQQPLSPTTSVKGSRPSVPIMRHLMLSPFPDLHRRLRLTEQHQPQMATQSAPCLHCHPQYRPCQRLVDGIPTRTYQMRMQIPWTPQLQQRWHTMRTSLQTPVRRRHALSWAHAPTPPHQTPTLRCRMACSNKIIWRNSTTVPMLPHCHRTPLRALSELRFTPGRIVTDSLLLSYR
jgi:hypothetical protein